MKKKKVMISELKKRKRMTTTDMKMKERVKITCEKNKKYKQQGIPQVYENG